MTNLEYAADAFYNPANAQIQGLTNPKDEFEDTLNSALLIKPQHAAELIRVTLYRLYNSVTRTEWKQIVRDTLLTHPIREVIHKDPFTFRAFSKPRGYAGDAVMIDYIYGYYDREDTVDDTGRAISSVSLNSPSTRAVRNRLNFIVNKIDQLVEKQAEAEILSVACGHCREFGLCQDFNDQPPKRFIAMDQDQESLKIVAQDYGSLGIIPTYGSVTSLLKNKGPEGKFNLIYALGLYDYLNQRLAQKLTQNLFNRLHSGGEVVVANFVPDILDIGYMESFMAWELIFRDRDQMEDLTNLIDPADIADYTVFTEPEKNIIFLSIKKK